MSDKKRDQSQKSQIKQATTKNLKACNHVIYCIHREKFFANFVMSEHH